MAIDVDSDVEVFRARGTFGASREGLRRLGRRHRGVLYRGSAFMRRNYLLT
jgi:hypothetical protein